MQTSCRNGRAGKLHNLRNHGRRDDHPATREALRNHVQRFPTITFKPGLHIISGRMIINSGATVKAEGVTFYFPDVNSEIRANGGLSFTATAPTSGTYRAS